MPACPKAEILIFTMHDSDVLVGELLEAGARAYLLKSDAKQYLIAAVEALADHQPFFTGRVSEQLLHSFLADPPGQGRGGLSPRERVIVQLIAEGHGNKEMGEILNLSVKTIETHRAAAMRKLNLATTAALVRYAIRNRLVEARRIRISRAARIGVNPSSRPTANDMDLQSQVTLHHGHTILITTIRMRHNSNVMEHCSGPQCAGVSRVLVSEPAQRARASGRFEPGNSECTGAVSVTLNPAVAAPLIVERLRGPMASLRGPLLVALAYFLGAQAAFFIGTLSDQIFALFWPPNVMLFVR